MIFETIAFALVIFFAVKFILKKSKLHGIPGPRPWPIVGNTLQVDMQKPHVTFLEWAKVYGPVFKINLAGTDTIIVMGTEPLHEMFVLKGEDFSSRDGIYRIKLWSMNYQDLLFVNYGPKFKWMKKAMMRGFKVHNLGHVEDITRDILGDVIENIKSQNNKAFDPSDMVYSLLFQVVYAMVFSHKIDKTNQQFKKIRQFDEDSADYCAFAGPNALLDLFPWLRFFGHIAYKKLMGTNEIARELFKEWKHEVTTGKMEGGWFKELLEAQKDPNLCLSEVNLMMLVLDSFIAGTVTTSSALLTFMNALVHNPEVQRKLQKEVDGVLKNSGQISFSNRDKMPYTFACTLEATRFATSVCLALPHKTMCDTSLQGYYIPKGTQVLANIWGQNHDPDLFPDPHEFKPERFLDSDGQILQAGTEPRKHLFTFGAGTRVCAGEVFALARMFVIMGSLAQHFTMLPATTMEEQASIHPHDYSMAVVLRPKLFTIRMEPRC